MTDKEIMKGIECCHDMTVNCDNCPYTKYPAKDCDVHLKEDVLALINRQRAEIDRLKNHIQYFYSEERIEQMEFEKKAIEYNAICKFAERLKSKCRTAPVSFNDNFYKVERVLLEYEIDNMVKETLKAGD